MSTVQEDMRELINSEMYTQTKKGTEDKLFAVPGASLSQREGEIQNRQSPQTSACLYLGQIIKIVLYPRSDLENQIQGFFYWLELQD